MKMKNLIIKNPEFFNEIIMSDEAHFTLFGSVNKQNMLFGGITNPSVAYQKLLHDGKVDVWCGICSKMMIGPFFFENDSGKL